MPWVYIAGYSLLIGNWVQAFAAYSPAALFASPLWTVSIEEQFYLLWPLIIRKASRQFIAWTAIALLVVANLSRVLLAFSHLPSRFDVISLNTVSNLDAIALGVLLALGLKTPPALSPVKRVALFLACTFVMIGVGGIIQVHVFTGAVLGRSLVAFSSAGILVSFLGIRHHAICNPVLQYLGKISYGLYVIHLSVWLCLRHFLNESASRYQTLGGRLEITVPAFALTILVASISYRWLESPFLRLKQRFTHVRSRPV
jgi:peptidoglycan/LPS O-acetylase OafA/YrhL